MEPVTMFQHHGIRRIIFKCGDYGLSVSTAEGRRFENHSLYVNNIPGLPTQYEALIIKDLKQIKDDEWDYNFIPDAEPKGWIYIEEVGELCEAIEAKGLEGWDSWNHREEYDG